jgi:undecaprenyl-diphosphatase
MNIFEGLILGLVQGLTEFLPVSSTGHLILAQQLLGLHTDSGLAIDATLHLATALAVAVYFRKDFVALFWAFVAMIQKREFRGPTPTLFIALALGTIPGVIFGLLFQKTIETTFQSAHIVAYGLLVGSLLFVAAEWFARQTASLTVKRGVIIGFFQVLALMPGMSRSGSTISGGLLLGMKREEAARFAFLLSFPIILGAGGTKFLDLMHSGPGAAGVVGFPLVVACIAAFVSGLAAIHFLITYLRNHTLYPFVAYRVLLALAILYFL